MHAKIGIKKQLQLQLNTLSVIRVIKYVSMVRNVKSH